MAAASINAILAVFALIAIVVFVLAVPLSRLLAPGFSPDQITTMSNLLKIMLGAQLFFSVSGFLTGIIQSHQRFLIPAMAPVVYNLGIIGGIFFLGSYTITISIMGTKFHGSDLVLMYTMNSVLWSVGSLVGPFLTGMAMDFSKYGLPFVLGVLVIFILPNKQKNV